MTIRALALAVLVTLSLFTRTTPAQTYTFNTPNGTWGTAANWTPSSGGVVVPNSLTAIARFNTASAYNADVDGTYDVLGLQFGANQTGTVNVRSVGTAPPTRQINLNPGTGANGSILGNNGRTTIYMESGAANQTISTAVLLSGGSAGAPVSHVWEVPASRTLTVSGQITATSSSGNTLTKDGAGTLALSNNNSGSPLWTGGLTVNQGTLLVNNPFGGGTGIGPVAVNSGATLGGRGVVAMGVSTTLAPIQTVISNGGTLFAGTSAGAPKLQFSPSNLGSNTGLRMDTGSTLAVKLFGTGATENSLVNVVNGDANVTGAKIAIDLGSVTPTNLRTAVGVGMTRTYTILTADNSLSGTGFTGGLMFSNLNGFDPSEWSFVNATDFNTGTGTVTLNYTAAPVSEPRSLLALATLAVVGFYGLRTRKNRDVI